MAMGHVTVQRLDLCWLLSQSAHKRTRFGTMNLSIRGQMAKVANTGGCARRIR
jgi:hypothetical protein